MKRSNKLLIFTGFIACVLILATGCTKNKKQENQGETAKKADTVRVSVKPVEKKDFIEYGEYYGELEGIKSALIISYRGGRVDALYVEEGDYVKKGDHLGRIDADRIVSQYETAVLSEKIAKENYEREKRHLENGNASSTAVDRARMQWLQSRTSLKEAAKARKGALCITPVSGIVTSRFIELYDELSPGSPVFKVVNMNVMKVKIGIPESEIGNISVGSRADVTFSIFPGETWEGKLSRLSREVSQHNRSFTAVVEINNSGRKLKPGITATVNLHLYTRVDVVMIPSGAVLPQGDRSVVMVAGKDGKAEKREVETGSSGSDETVIESGLKEGDMLIVEGHQLVKDGTFIRVSE